MENSSRKSGAKLPYFDDLHVGQRFLSRQEQIPKSHIRAFATQFDPQPFHLDDKSAQDTFFQGLAASGWHSAAITMRLLVGSLPIAGGIVGAGGALGRSQRDQPLSCMSKAKWSS